MPIFEIKALAGLRDMDWWLTNPGVYFDQILPIYLT